MPMWRCPHCGTPQAETSRCWVCRRSSTACGTCRHFRRSVAAKVGYCGLDRRRAPLHGDEIRACWEAGGLPAAPTLPVMPLFGPPVTERGTLDFVEVAGDGSELADQPGVAASGVGAAVAATQAPDVEPLFERPAPGATSAEPRWSLWADLEA